MNAPLWVVYTIDIIGSALTIVICTVALVRMRRTYLSRKEYGLHTYLYVQTIALFIFAVSRSSGHIIKHGLLTFGYQGIWKALAPVSGSINSFAFIGFGLSAILYSNVRDITRRIDDIEESRAALKKSLLEKEVLLQEVHHRVKNNMAVISSLLHMQSMLIDDKNFQQILKDCRQRVKSMALVHEKLYQSNSLADISIRDYMLDLVEDLKAFYSKPNIRVSIEAENLYIGLDSLIPLGLTANEIVSNSLKYAFLNNASPEIRINLRREGDEIVFEISDNGPGFDETAANETKSLGLKIIIALVGQLRGKCERRTKGEVAYKITFPLQIRSAP